jgi:hypothetical protein
LEKGWRNDDQEDSNPRGNLDKQLPLDGRAAGAKPPMTEQQVSDLVCFLRTLTDADVGPSNVRATPLDCDR